MAVKATLKALHSLGAEVKRLQAEVSEKDQQIQRLRPSHGGYREGSGRKAILDGGIKRTFVLTQAHLAQIDAWGRAHNIDNRSAALRHMIEQAALSSR